MYCYDSNYYLRNRSQQKSNVAGSIGNVHKMMRRKQDQRFVRSSGIPGAKMTRKRNSDWVILAIKCFVPLVIEMPHPFGTITSRPSIRKHPSFKNIEKLYQLMMIIQISTGICGHQIFLNDDIARPL